MTMYETLLEELKRLSSAFEARNIPLLIGGGMGLFLRETFYRQEQQARYAVALPIRPTHDLDVFLAAEIIVDSRAMNAIRDLLAELEYEPKERYFQFVKDVDPSHHRREVKIDLLAAPPPDREAVQVKGPRIRPKESKNIHAYLTREAEAIARDTIAIRFPVEHYRDAGGMSNVFIPSSYNFLILKLHAFHDRKDRDDMLSDRGRHHALDILRTVMDMTAADWEAAKRHHADDHTRPYLRQAIEYRQRYFASADAEGILRLKENASYRSRRDELDPLIPLVIDDLEELFASLLS